MCEEQKEDVATFRHMISMLKGTIQLTREEKAKSEQDSRDKQKHLELKLAERNARIKEQDKELVALRKKAKDYEGLQCRVAEAEDLVETLQRKKKELKNELLRLQIHLSGVDLFVQNLMRDNHTLAAQIKMKSGPV